MPRVAQQILTRANIQIVEEKTDQNTSIHKCTKDLSLHFFLGCDYSGCKNPVRRPVAPRWWLPRTGYSSIRATKLSLKKKKKKKNFCQLGVKRK